MQRYALTLSALSRTVSTKVVVFGSICFALFILTVAYFFLFDEFSAAKDAARQVLKDPASAQFRNVRKSNRNSRIVCGEVNARNTYGGYVGFKSFVYRHDTGRIIIGNAGARDSRAIDLQLELLKYFTPDANDRWDCEPYSIRN